MDSTAKIRELNDALRTLTGEGRIVFTAGIAALPLPERSAIMDRVVAFTAFAPDNDPHGEHDPHRDGGLKPVLVRLRMAE